MAWLPVPSGRGAKLFGAAIAATALALPAVAAAAPGGSPGSGGASSDGVTQASSNATTPVCLPPQAGFASCDSIVLNDPVAWQGSRSPSPSSGTPSGYGPSQLQSAYGLANVSSTNGSGKTVAIVDAYSDAMVASDLAVYRAQYGLPCMVGTSSSCPSGGPTLTVDNLASQGNTSWGEEISLDVDMVSANCPDCNILLVEAASNSYANLGAAENTAAGGRGVVAISNSYGGGEGSGEISLDSYYYHPTMAVTASSGDGGYGVEYPAASPDVTAVGGTHLTQSSGVWSETVWSGAGSGCSRYEPNPGWQPVTTLCSNRTVADVAADADPNTGVAVYDTYGESGWMVFGGTSVASPIIASIYALSGTTSPQALYGDTSLYRVNSGQNTRHCSGAYLCNAGLSLGSTSNALTWTGSATWYNGPTGNGTPRGITGF